MAQISYRNSTTTFTATVANAQTISSEVNTSNLSGSDDTGGAFAALRFVFPAGFVACNVTFQVFEDENFTGAGTTLTYNDAAYTLAAAENQTHSVLPFLFLTIPFFKVNCSVAQTGIDVGVVCQPVIQVLK